jgi:uncharacterized protein YukJ
MALSGYGVLAARVLEARSERDADTPHYQIRVSGQGVEFRVVVNVLSQQAPSELLFVETCSTGGRCARCRRPSRAPTMTSRTRLSTSSVGRRPTRTPRLYAFGQRWGAEADTPDKGLRLRARKRCPRYPHESGQHRPVR